MMVTTTTQREIIHWLWLWLLTAMAITVMQGVLLGQTPGQIGPGGKSELRPHPGGDVGQPIPMPNVDHPEWFHYPDAMPGEGPEGGQVGLVELLEMHRSGELEKSLKGWQALRVTADSQTWKEVALGALLLRLDRLEKALDHLDSALDIDPSNAVAEYFQGRVRQAQGRQVPFWYEPDQETPYRLASFTLPESTAPRGKWDGGERRRSKMFLPHFIDDAYDRLARQHFRRAIALAPKCDLEQEIRIVTEPTATLQLASMKGPGAGESVTVGDLLDSLGERDYVHKAIAELGVHRLK